MIPIVDVHDNQATRFSIVDLELQIKTVDIHQIKYYKLLNFVLCSVPMSHPDLLSIDQ